MYFSFKTAAQGAAFNCAVGGNNNAADSRQSHYHPNKELLLSLPQRHYALLVYFCKNDEISGAECVPALLFSERRRRNEPTFARRSTGRKKRLKGDCFCDDLPKNLTTARYGDSRGR